MQAHTAQEETQRMIAVRKAYQRAVVTPTHHVEQLWKDYESFENSVSRALVLLSFCLMCFWFVNNFGLFFIKHVVSDGKDVFACRSCALHVVSIINLD